MTESKKLDPIVSEFATQEEADAHDAWFRKKVQESLDDPGPDVPHEEVMRRARETIERAAARGLAEGKQAAYETLDPIVSEFATQKEADDHDVWFRGKVQAALHDPRPGVPNDQAMARIDAAIREAASRSRGR